MKFVADDGKVFDTMEECEEYEKMGEEGRKIARLWYNYVTTYDSIGQITEPSSDLNDTANFLNDICGIINCQDSSFICIASDCVEWKEICDFFRFEYGAILPESTGTWRYDWKELKWVSLRAEVETLKNNWAPMGIHF